MARGAGDEARGTGRRAQDADAGCEARGESIGAGRERLELGAWYAGRWARGAGCEARTMRIVGLLNRLNSKLCGGRKYLFSLVF